MRPLLLLLCALGLTAAHPRLDFTALAPEHRAAAEAYRAIWESEGADMIAALETASGLAFPAGAIDVIVSNGPPMTAYDGRSMRLSASYGPAYMRATLVHELGHRLALTLPDGGGLDDHRLLYLFLHDAWAELYGRDFADRMARAERRIGPHYAEAWDWALALGPDERRRRLAALRPAWPRLPYRLTLLED